jgi:cytoskeletal protein CcmA (bactofilin family)
MGKRFAYGALLALILVLALALPVMAQGEQPGKLIMGGSYTLESGERLEGGVAIAGGDVILQEGSVVEGDVLLAGGRLRVSGRIDGDVAVFGGSLQLQNTAVVDGDVVSFGGSISQQPGAEVTGDIQAGGELVLPGLDRIFPVLPDLGAVPVPPEFGYRPSPLNWLLSQLLRFMRSLALTLALGALAVVVAVIWPKGIERIGHTELEQPFLAFAVGLLTWVLGAGLMVVMAITICLLPFALLIGLALLVVAVLAWIATGWVVGRQLLAALKIGQPTTLVEAGVGTVLLALTYFLVGLIPCLDFIFGAVVASVGTGAIVLTRFGTQPYVPAPARSATAPAPDALALPEPDSPASGPPALPPNRDLDLPPED